MFFLFLCLLKKCLFQSRREVLCRGRSEEMGYCTEEGKVLGWGRAGSREGGIIVEKMEGFGKKN